MALIDIKVPDIGDFDEVAVIELLVKAGAVVKAEQSLITVESDKASMEIPCSQAGVVKEIKVKLGDKVKQGYVVLVLEGDATASAAAPAASAWCTSWLLARRRCTGPSAVAAAAAARGQRRRPTWRPRRRPPRCPRRRPPWRPLRRSASHRGLMSGRRAWRQWQQLWPAVRWPPRLHPSRLHPSRLHPSASRRSCDGSAGSI